MTDSVAVLSISDKLIYQDAAVSGGKYKFYDAGTTTPKTVYSDAALSNSLGSVVYTDSEGYAVTASGGSTRCEIYTGTASYKVIITNSSDTTLKTLDNIKGALNTSSFATGTLSNGMPVVSKTSNYTIEIVDGYGVINANPSGGAFTLTLPSAVTAGDEWWIAVRLNASATSNAVTIATVSSQTVRHKTGAVTSFAVSGGGSGGFIVSDGSGWNWIPCEVAGGGDYQSTTIASATTTDIGASTSPVVTVSGTTTITGFGTAPNRYRIVVFSGALTLTHNGTSLILPGAANITTAAGDVFGFVSDSSGNWRCIFQNVTPASQTLLEAASNTTAYVSPGRMIYHPGVAKAWLSYDQTVPSNKLDFGVSSVSDDSAGVFTVNFDTAFSTANYSTGSFVQATGTVEHIIHALSTNAKSASARVIRTSNTAGTPGDDTDDNVQFFGDV